MFFLFFALSRSSFIDFYGSNAEIVPCFSSRVDISSYPNVYIQFCGFFSFSSNSAGGVVYVSNGNALILVEFCNIDNCRSTATGGVFYFSCLSLIQSKICVHQAHTNDHCTYGVFSATNKNEIYYVTICHSSPESSVTSNHNILALNGYQKIQNLNSTKNRGKREVALTVQDCINLNVLQCNFVQNTAIDERILWFNRGSNERKFVQINVVENNSPNGGVIVNENAAYSFQSCYFHSNSRILFYLISGSLTISTSYIYHTNTLTYGAVSIQSSVSSSNQNSITFLKTGNCKAGIPFIYWSHESIRYPRNTVMYMFFILFF